MKRVRAAESRRVFARTRVGGGSRASARRAQARGASSGSRRAAPRPREARARAFSSAMGSSARLFASATGAARRGRARGRDRVDARRLGSRASDAAGARRDHRAHLAGARRGEAPGVGARAAHPSAREGTRRGVALGAGSASRPFTSATRASRTLRARGTMRGTESWERGETINARNRRSRSWRRWDASWPRGRATCPTKRRVAGLSERENRRERVERATPSMCIPQEQLSVSEQERGGAALRRRPGRASRGDEWSKSVEV